MLESLTTIFSNTSPFQIAFYIISPIATFLAVGTAYLAIYRQSKPLILVYYEPSNNVGSVIELVISNHGNGTARNIKFSEPIPIHCWGIEAPASIDTSKFQNHTIPVLAAGKELRYDGGQYYGLFSSIGESKNITANYEYRTPLQTRKQGYDTSILDVRHMQLMASRNSAAHDISDAMKGRNNTVFVKLNNTLTSIDYSLSKISESLKQETHVD